MPIYPHGPETLANNYFKPVTEKTARSWQHSQPQH